LSARPSFSIVTPSLDQCRYIESTIRSVIDQEGEFELDYFIMDGGSTDGSVEIIRRYADLVNGGTYPLRCLRASIHWISERDSGQSNAINRGLRQATGDYAAYINSDDVYLPGAFAFVAQEFEANPDVDFLYGDGDVIDESERLQWEWLSRPYDHRVMTTYHFLWNDFTNYIMQQSTFWRSAVHQRIGLFDETFQYAMDVEYWVRAGAASLTLMHTPRKLAKFRMIQGTKSLSGPDVFWGDMLEIYRRYRGAGSLYPYLAYYYFNLAKHNGWDLNAARIEANRNLDRWASLNGPEPDIIAGQQARAEGMACFLVANEMQRQKRFHEAARFIYLGLKIRPGMLLRPTGAYPVLKQVMGIRCAQFLDCMTDWAITRYRDVRFDYRYQNRANDQT
jgi:glycosyltransferase involved in cell wall biosynthesis